MNKNALPIAQINKVKSFQTLDDIDIIVESHKKINGAKTVVRSKAFNKSSCEDIQKHLKEKGVSEVREIKIRKEAELIDTNTYILTFKSSNYPRVLRITQWHYEHVEEYKYKPGQCDRCLIYGHVSAPNAARLVIRKTNAVRKPTAYIAMDSTSALTNETLNTAVKQPY